MDNDSPTCRPAPSLAHIARPAGSLVLAAVLAVPFVLFSAFTGISWFDDEGTLLVGFRSLLDGHRLYDEIYSLYGPMYNAFYRLIYVALGVPLTHMAGRTIAAALWIGYTAGFAAFCYCVTRSIPAMLIGFLFVLVWLARLMESPGHPEEMCLILLATVLLLVYSVERTPGIATWAGIGAAVAALAMVKINIGAYVGGGVLLIFLRATTPAAWTKIAITVMAVALLSLPLAIGILLFDFEWVRHYVVFATLTIAAALIVSLNVPMPSVIRPANWSIIVIAGGLTCFAVIGGTIVAGSSAHAILTAVLLQNADFIRNWYLPLYSVSRDLITAAASALFAVGYCVSGSRPSLRECRQVGILILKFYIIVVGIGHFVITQGPIFLNDAHVFGFEVQIFLTLTPFCWLLMIPSTENGSRPTVGRCTVGLVGAIMSLYPFPVAGHQINIGGLLPILMLPILACDVLEALHKRGIVTWLPSPLRTGLAVVVVFVLGTAKTLQSAHIYLDNAMLGLPGSGFIRTSQEQADDLRWVTAELSTCRASYSLPGMYSFNFWTGHALATSLNTNDMLAFISPTQQDSIVQALSRQTDLCIVYNEAFLEKFDRGQIKTSPPLLRYLKRDFVAEAQRNGYMILKRPISMQSISKQFGAAQVGLAHDRTE